MPLRLDASAPGFEKEFSAFLGRNRDTDENVDRIVAGTDFPQGMSVKQPVDFVESIPGLTERECEMILCDNPARLLRLA